MPSTTHVLWVFAHPDRRSLNRALFDGAVGEVRRRGAEVTTSDLHTMSWKPVLDDADFSEASGDTLSTRQRRATVDGSLTADIRAEQDKILAASVVVVQFPLWWYGMPAILKGWFDRVFTNGFAFGVRDDAGRVRKYGDGGLRGRTLLPVVTAGDRASALGPLGISGDIDEVLWPLLHGTAHYTGMRAMPTHLVPEIEHTDGVDPSRERDRLVNRIIGLAHERPIPYRALRGGDYDDTHVLRAPDAVPSGFAAHRRDR